MYLHVYIYVLDLVTSFTMHMTKNLICVCKTKTFKKNNCNMCAELLKYSKVEYHCGYLYNRHYLYTRKVKIYFTFKMLYI